MNVEHAGYAVEPKPIEPVLFHPKVQVTEKEPEHFVVSIIK